MVALESIFVLCHEMPVQGVKGAGAFAGPLLHAVVTALAVVAHFFDVVSACCIRLGANEPAVGVERHTPCIGEFDPLQCIQINTKIPVIHCGRIDPGKQTEITGNHQPLNVVSIAVVEGIGDGFLQAAHARFPGPEILR